jgi:AraC family transcriptional regulator of adaptative response/methylated-DNA-[protein]-cysteine methyltransferase
MMTAFLGGDSDYDGVFVTAVRTTGIFCRPSCPARKPNPENVEFFACPRDALLAGYRPCKRCTPLADIGAAPEWLAPLLAEIERDPARRWSDADLRELGLTPDRVRRWFKTNHGMTFHAYSRARRLGRALGQLRFGDRVIDAALDAEYESLSGFADAFAGFFGDAPSRAASASTAVVVDRLLTPLGPMLIGASERGVCLAEFVDRRMLETQLARLRDRLGAALVPGTTELLGELSAKLGRYFAGELERFDVPLDLPGTEFQQRVWSALRAVPYGATASYGDLARSLGRPSAVRAVARANGDNRVAILVPCHRIIGSDGSLTGYGGGLWRKQKLLDHERGEHVLGNYRGEHAASLA